METIYRLVSILPPSCHKKVFSTICRSKNGQKKNLLLTILKTCPTKRAAKVYLQNFAPTQTGLVVSTPFSMRSLNSSSLEYMHVALLRVYEADLQEESVLTGICHSIVQLRHLGLISTVVIEPCNSVYSLNRMQRRTHLFRTMERIAYAIEKEGGQAQIVTNGFYETREGSLFIENIKLYSNPLHRCQVPIMTTSCDASTKSAEEQTNDLLYALTQLFSRNAKAENLLLDKIFILNRDGGIPSQERGGSCHVFINLQQEFKSIKNSLLESNSTRHLGILELVNKCLAILPYTSSAIVTTPELVKSDMSNCQASSHPLIYSLLTDRPAFSSSLPIGAARTPKSTTSVIRYGVSVCQIDNLASLKDSRVDFSRLKALIEDSFSRKLDLTHYQNRLKGKLATIIVVGDYEGCAITTYEETSLGFKVPYLDKFAVLKSRQGSSCLADILFRALTNTFPTEIFWRSRVNNPVNTWYFERSKFTWKIPNSEWCLFWTGKLEYPAHITEYIKIVQSIEPSLT